VPSAPEPRGPLPQRPLGFSRRREETHNTFGADLRNQVQILKLIGMFLALTCPAWMIALLFTSDYEGFEYLTALFIIPILLVPTLLLVLRVTHKDPFLRMIMFVSIGAKLASCGAYMYLVFKVYGRSADALHYADAATVLVRGFVSFNQAPILYPFWSSNFIIMLIAWVYIVFGVSFQSVTVLFALIGLAGQYFLFKAFQTVFPHQQPYTFGMLVFLLPSITFWSSPPGKDAIILLGIGLVCYGFALMSRRAGFNGYLLVAAGLGVCMLVRPHIALLLAMSVLIPYLVGEHLTGTTGMVLKISSLPIFVLGLLYLATQASSFLSVSDFSQTAELVNRVGEVNAVGGSSVGSMSLPVRVALGPFLMFRPFFWEVHNPQAAVACLEGLLLALYCWRKRHNVKASLRQWRRNSFVTFILCYSVGFIVVFSAAITNLGLLSRQRIMMIPVTLMIFAGTTSARDVAAVTGRLKTAARFVRRTRPQMAPSVHADWTSKV
jgi:hypothetical protein